MIAGSHEERFSRVKHDSSFPIQSIRYVLKHANIDLNTLDAIVFYEKPFIKWERLLETYIEYSPSGIKSFLKAMPIWLKEKLFLKQELKKRFRELGSFDFDNKPIEFSDHHLSHACAAYYTSGFDRSAILTVDGVGEWACSTIFKADKNEIRKISQINFPHSVGLFYSAITSFLGFKVNSGEYKVMGLAPYGQSEKAAHLVKKMKEGLITIFDNGSIFLNLEAFHFVGNERMYRREKLESLLCLQERREESKLDQDNANLALALQMITEEVLLKMCKHALQICETNSICFSGGVALNAVANGKLRKLLSDVNFHFCQNAGDAGAALGAAYASYFLESKNIHENFFEVYSGPSFSEDEILKLLNDKRCNYKQYSSYIDLCKEVVDKISKGGLCGWFRGRMEWGPRALGNRSILADARRSDVQQRLNLAVKFRESFRPFAPIILEEQLSNYFDDESADPYMITVRKFKDIFQKFQFSEIENLSMEDKRNLIKSDFPAITHIDYTARVQTVSKNTNPDLYFLLKMFFQETACPMLVNTSFNVRGEPIVCSPEDAWNCFMNSGLDFLVLENFVLVKEDQKNSIFTKIEYKPD